MGIKNLTKLLNDMAPDAVKEITLKQLMGRKLAIDASNFIYQFLVAVRASDGDGPAQMLTNEAGEVTSHLQGMMSRTIRLLEAGVKPVFVFDGKPPKMKEEEIAKRREARAQAEKDLATAQEGGSREDVEKYSKRTIVMTKQHQEDCKRLLQLMGMPVLTAPCEAEAQCAELAKGGVVWGVASEDMDTLTFGAPNMVRRITMSEARNQPPLHFNLEKALAGLGMTQDQFIDMCILCGSDYTKKTISGVGPKNAYKLVKAEGSMEGVIKKVPADKLPPAEAFRWEEARELFRAHEVTAAKDFTPKWVDADEPGVLKLLCEEKGFSVDRVNNAMKRLKKARSVGNQKRMDSFFSFGGAKKDPFKAAAGAGGAAAGAAGGSGKKPAAKKVGGVKRSITPTAAKSRKK